MTKLERLRAELQRQGLSALIVPSNDPHFSEYIADYWKCREYISGFSGSMGTVAVTLDKAALWTDSRYFLQAEQQLNSADFQLQRILMPETPTIEQWLVDNLPAGAVVGVDGKLFSKTAYAKIDNEIKPLGLKSVEDPFINAWENRPAMPAKKAFLLDEKYSGESVASKLERLNKRLGAQRDGVYLLSVLDDIAWLFNLRGDDINYNPLSIAYAAVSTKGTRLFVGASRMDKNDVRKLEAAGVKVEEYSDFSKYLETLGGQKVVCNYNRFDVFHYNILERAGAKIEDEKCAPGYVNMMKSIKNACEIEGFKESMVLDGIAMVRFWMWLEKAVANGGTSEIEVSRTSAHFRSQQDKFMGISFPPIVGYKTNGAVVHYSVTEESSQPIYNDGFMLIDSGGQYLCGTTDITRTFHFSTPTKQEREDFTVVLKGMIALTCAVFPENTRGCLLDILARQYMFKAGIRYLHGTGHGVGHFLNVHEGPQSIRAEENPVVMEAGMVMTNEPAFYRTGLYGLRTENMMVCVPYKKTEFGKFLTFETITLCPIDTTPIDVDLLSEEEIKWINDYHDMVYQKLHNYLTEQEQEWLKSKTKPISK